MEIIDSHCHLDIAAFDHDRAEVLQRCREQGIRGIVVPAIDAAGWPGLLALCKAEPGLYPALGLHPVFLPQHGEDDLQQLEQLLQSEQPVALGEIGLDYYLKELDREQQQALFAAQLALAEQYQLPVILHVRKAHDAVLALLKQYRLPGGICHAFNGSVQQAQQYLDLGFKLGFGGTLTYANARHIHQLATTLPLTAMVLETDAPDMTVASHRGERNSPAYLTETLAALATLRGEAAEQIAAQTTRNVCEVLQLEHVNDA